MLLRLWSRCQTARSAQRNWIPMVPRDSARSVCFKALSIVQLARTNPELKPSIRQRLPVMTASALITSFDL